MRRTVKKFKIFGGSRSLPKGLIEMKHTNESPPYITLNGCKVSINSVQPFLESFSKSYVPVFVNENYKRNGIVKVRAGIKRSHDLARREPKRERKAV